MSDNKPSSSQPGSSGGQDEESKSSPQQEYSEMHSISGDNQSPVISKISSVIEGAAYNGSSTADETIG